MNPDLYIYRPPIDLTNPRLRAMAQALGPAYVRISGTWANTTFFDPGETPVETPPKGYGAVLTRDQWLGVIELSKAVDAPPIVTSMPVGMGIRDAKGRGFPSTHDAGWPSPGRAAEGSLQRSSSTSRPWLRWAARQKTIARRIMAAITGCLKG